MQFLIKNINLQVFFLSMQASTSCWTREENQPLNFSFLYSVGNEMGQLLVTSHFFLVSKDMGDLTRLNLSFKLLRFKY